MAAGLITESEILLFAKLFFSKAIEREVLLACLNTHLMLLLRRNSLQCLNDKWDNA